MSNFIRLRWLVLLIFVFGVIATPMSQHSLFVWQSIAAIIACATLLTQLDAPAKDTLWVWLILFTFLIGYYLKTYMMALSISSHTVSENFSRELAWVSERVLLESYYWITVGFIFFCLSSWLLLLINQGNQSRHPLSIVPETNSLANKVVQNRVKALLLVTFAVSLTILITQAYLRLSVLGLESTRLPLRLDMLMHRGRSDVISAILLLCIWLLDDKRSPKWGLLAVFLFFIHSIMGSIVQTSRGGLITFGIPLLSLWILTSRFTKARKLSLLLITTIGLVILIPLTTEMRILWIQKPYLGFSDTLFVAVSNLVSDSSITEMARGTVGYLLVRINGANGIWYALEALPTQFSFDRIIALLSNTPVHIYYTRLVVGNNNPIDFRAPGFIGTFMLLGGMIGVVGFTFLFVLFTRFMWQQLSRLYIVPVAEASFILYLMVLSIEGKFLFRNFIAWTVAILICEFIFRKALLFRDSIEVDAPVSTSYISGANHI